MDRNEGKNRRPTDAENWEAIAGDEPTIRRLLHKYATRPDLREFSQTASFAAAQFALLAVFESLTLARPLTTSLDRWRTEIAFSFDRGAALEMENLRG